MADATSTTATTEVPAKHEAAGFPPFKTETFPSQLFWMVMSFVALYGIVSAFIAPRVGGVLDRSRSKIGALGSVAIVSASARGASGASCTRARR